MFQAYAAVAGVPQCGARPPAVRGTSAPLHVNRGAARVDIGRAYILIMLVISKIIIIRYERHVRLMWNACRPICGKLQYFCFSLPLGANVDCVPLSHSWLRPYIQST